MSRLDELVAAAREDVRLRKRGLEPESLRAQAGTPRASGRFRDALSRPGLALVAEFKRRSPSSGDIRPGASVADIVSAYERGGAAALSVLTDGRSFGGSLDDLREARVASELPILRKDFVVDPYQLHEAALSGADAVLLIVAALDDEPLRALHDEASALGLDCLVEVHDEAELERALAVDADPIGINNRDLTDLSVDVDTAARLLAEMPDGKTVVAESGYERRDQLDVLERSGAAGVLVGEALMRAADPEAAVRALVA
jgi:indole-3-glycerol phosphate synthase